MKRGRDAGCLMCRDNAASEEEKKPVESGATASEGSWGAGFSVALVGWGSVK